MRPFIFLLLGLFLVSPLAAQDMRMIEKSDAEIDTAIILYGRACRGASDQEWLAICTAATAQAIKELEAKKPKPPAEKKP